MLAVNNSVITNVETEVPGENELRYGRRTVEGSATHSVWLPSEPLVQTRRVDTDPQGPLSRPEKGQPSPGRLYPHLFDINEPSGQVIQLVSNAISDAEAALEAFESSDLQEISTKLGTIAVAMKVAHQLTTFNEDFGAVVSFIRRAAINADASELDRHALNSLARCLIELKDHPAIDLTGAAELIDRLISAGWQGDLAATKAIVEFIFSQSDEDEDIQEELFTFLTGDGL